MKEVFNKRVPVVDKNGKPLMPTSASRARRWIKEKKATYFFKKGIFCIRLNFDSKTSYRQEVACGIDPGSKFEAFTVKSKAHTIINIQSDATTWVKDNIQVRKEMRRKRRNRKTPCRKPRFNRSSSMKKNRIPPSTKARWQTKLRIINMLRIILPITNYIIEDTAAVSKKGNKSWNTRFSPLEFGKNWFYKEIKKLGKLVTACGYETKALRDSLGLTKSKNNQYAFNAHCVDSWVLANSLVGGHLIPEYNGMLILTPLRFHRRRLHTLQPSRNNKRRIYGGTISLGLKRGSIVRHTKHGLCYIGGSSKNMVSLHRIRDGVRVTQNGHLKDIKYLGHNSWRWRSV